CQQAYSKPLTF
nr:immunoglobulin light chain junction region [Macaca mulatta]MOW41754.1 immunoglobulin light chain junction region [Macaca mulatta]MOW42609.1 immunoglobulin light chain junction region [Macaca mulatta]MOW43779.1 immunoglobulin light chain junction region [Macaca mulatta]MOW44073.1 immunoglobulin light chain junction region [Macaca mulatta]